MTQTRYDMPAAGGDKTIVTLNTGGSIGTSVVRVMVDDATAYNKQQVIKALILIVQRIHEGPWPLA